MDDKEAAIVHKNIIDLSKLVSKIHSSNKYEDIFSEKAITARSKIRLLSLKLILFNPLKYVNLEEVIWRKVYYEPISTLRYSSSIIVKAKLRLLTMSAESFYHQLIMKLCKTFTISSRVSVILANLLPIQIQGQVSPLDASQALAECIESCIYQIILYLGDLFRYGNRFGQPNANTISMNYYNLCIQLCPTNGIAYNQLGLLNYISECQQLTCTFHFLRALTVYRKPFSGGLKNLLAYLKSNESTFYEIRDDHSPLMDHLTYKGPKDFTFSFKHLQELSIRLLHVIFDMFNQKSKDYEKPNDMASNCSAIIRDVNLIHEIEDFSMSGMIFKLHRNAWSVFRPDTQKVDYSKITLNEIFSDPNLLVNKVVSNFSASDNCQFHALIVYMVGVMIMSIDLNLDQSELKGDHDDEMEGISMLSLLFAISDNLMSHLSWRFNEAMKQVIYPFRMNKFKEHMEDCSSQNQHSDNEENNDITGNKGSNLSSTDGNSSDDKQDKSKDENKKLKLFSLRSSTDSDCADSDPYDVLSDSEKKTFFGNQRERRGGNSIDSDDSHRLVFIQPSSSSCVSESDNESGEKDPIDGDDETKASVDLDFDPNEERELLTSNPSKSNEKDEIENVDKEKAADNPPKRNPIPDIDSAMDREMRIIFGSVEYLTSNLLMTLETFFIWLMQSRRGTLEQIKRSMKPLRIWSAKLALIMNKLAPLISFLKSECEEQLRLDQDDSPKGAAPHKIIFLSRIENGELRVNVCRVFLGDERQMIPLPEDKLLLGLKSMREHHEKISFEDEDLVSCDEIGTVFTFYRIRRLVKFSEFLSKNSKALGIEFTLEPNFNVVTEKSAYEEVMRIDISANLQKMMKKGRKQSRRVRSRNQRRSYAKTAGNESVSAKRSQEKKPATSSNVKGAIEETPEEAAQRKDETMRRLAKLRLTSEIDQLKTQMVHDSCNNDGRNESPELSIEEKNTSKLPPYLVLDTATIVGHIEFIKTIAKSKYFMIIVPDAVIGHLDYLKMKTVLARTSIRFLEQTTSDGNESFKIQKSDEFPTPETVPNYVQYSMKGVCLKRLGKTTDENEDEPGDRPMCNQRTIKRYSSIISTAINLAHKSSKETWNPRVYRPDDNVCSEGHVDLLDPSDFDINNSLPSNVSIVLSNKFRRTACSIGAKDCIVPISLVKYAHNYGVNFLSLTSLMKSYKQIKQKTR